MSFRRRVLGSLFLFALVPTFACSDVEPIPIEQYDEVLNRSLCDWFLRCGLYDTMQTCLADSYHDWLSLQGVADGTIEYDGAAAAACLDTSDWPCSLATRPSSSACDDAFRGTLGEGASCYTHQQCISNVCTGACDYMCCPGICAAGDGTPGVIGSVCTPGSCSDANYCGTDAVCHALKPLGEACVYRYECGDGLSCYSLISEGGGQSTTCRPVLGLGDPCPAWPAFCGLNTLGLACDFTSTVTCQPYLLEGQACEPGSNDACAAAYLRCSPAQRCERKLAPGDACTSSGTCAGGVYCDIGAGLCRTYKQEGESCPAPERCDFHLTCNPTSLVCEQTICS